MRSMDEKSAFVTSFSIEQWAAITKLLGLSARERDIAAMIIDDATEGKIASGLGISRHTVHTYVNRLFQKTGVSSRRQLVVKLFSVRDSVKSSIRV